MVDHVEPGAAFGVVDGRDVDQGREPAGRIVAQEFDQGFQVRKVGNNRQLAGQFVQGFGHAYLTNVPVRRIFRCN
jgi:hypothetical protein